MLKSLTLTKFTVFSAANFDFAPALNVIIGENGAGKSHILKLAYSAIDFVARAALDSSTGSPTKASIQTGIANELVAIFMPDDLGRLVRRGGSGRKNCEIVCQFDRGPEQLLKFSFNVVSKSAVTVQQFPAEIKDVPLPVFLPTRELLTISRGFASVYEHTKIPFEATWNDLCLLLEAPLARGPRAQRIKILLEPLEAAMGGKVDQDASGHFYLRSTATGVRTEMYLVAEGIRKLAMIARLIATGSLVDVGALFWDEPESNLNPKLIKVVARTILHLCQNNIQVFLATHSLFLLRELDILLQTAEFKDTLARFFGLHPGADGVAVQQGDSIDDVGTIDALDEQLSQSDRYLNA